MNYENSKTLCVQLNNRRNPYLRKWQSAQEMRGNHQPTRQEILRLPFAVGVRSSGYGQAYRQGERSDGDTAVVRERGESPSFLFGFLRRPRAIDAAGSAVNSHFAQKSRANFVQNYLLTFS